MNKKNMESIQNLNISSILKLATNSSDENATSQNNLKIILRNGREFYGSPLKVVEENRELILLLKQIPGVHKTSDLTGYSFVLISEIVAVNFESEESLNSNLKIQNQSFSFEPLNKLSARRMFEKLKTEKTIHDLFQIDWDSFVCGDDQWGIIIGFINKVNQYLNDLQIDSTGQNILKSILSISLSGCRQGDHQFKFNDGKLIILFNVEDLSLFANNNLKIKLDSIF